MRCRTGYDRAKCDTLDEALRVFIVDTNVVHCSQVRSGRHEAQTYATRRTGLIDLGWLQKNVEYSIERTVIFVGDADHNRVLLIEVCRGLVVQRYLYPMGAVTHAGATVRISAEVADSDLRDIRSTATLQGHKIDGIGGNKPSRCQDRSIAHDRRVDGDLYCPVALPKSEHSPLNLPCIVRGEKSVTNENIQSMLSAHLMRQYRRTQLSRFSPIAGTLDTPWQFRAASCRDLPAELFHWPRHPHYDAL